MLLRLGIVLLAVIGVIAVMNWPVSDDSDDSSLPQTVAVVTGDSGSSTFVAYDYPDGFHCGAFVPSRERDDVIRHPVLYDTLEAAMEDLGFEFILPRSSLAGEVFQICGNKKNFTENRAIVFMDSGLFFSAFPHEYPVDFEKWVGWNRDEWDKGWLKTDRPPEVIEVRGGKAWSLEPGLTRPGIHTGYDPRPGNIYWQEAEVEYRLSGTSGDAALSLEQLVEIVESFE